MKLLMSLSDAPVVKTPEVGDWVSNPTPDDSTEGDEDDDYVCNRSILSIKGGKVKLLSFESTRSTFSVDVKALVFSGMSGSRKIWKIK